VVKYIENLLKIIGQRHKVLHGIAISSEFESDPEYE